MTPAEQFFAQWLRGCTCSSKRPDVRSIHWQSKHAGHNEYINTWSPSNWCGTYYRLYDVTGKQPDKIFGRPALYAVDGRWSWRHQIEVLAIVGRIQDEEALTLARKFRGRKQTQ